MRSVKYQTGTNYDLWIGGENDPPAKVSIGIRMKDRTFKQGTNFVAVLLDDKTIISLIVELKARLLEKL